MATSDQVINQIAESVAALGAPDEYLEFLRTAMYAVIKLGIAEHQFAVEAAEGQYRHYL